MPSNELGYDLHFEYCANSKPIGFIHSIEDKDDGIVFKIGTAESMREKPTEKEMRMEMFFNNISDEHGSFEFKVLNPEAYDTLMQILAHYEKTHKPESIAEEDVKQAEEFEEMINAQMEKLNENEKSEIKNKKQSKMLSGYLLYRLFSHILANGSDIEFQPNDSSCYSIEIGLLDFGELENCFEMTIKEAMELMSNEHE